MLQRYAYINKVQQSTLKLTKVQLKLTLVIKSHIIIVNNNAERIIYYGRQVL